MNDMWTNRLSEYLDGELDNAERVALEAHLETCGHCYATLGELRQVITRAQSLQDTPPAKDLWLGIRAGIAGSGAVVDRPVRRDRRRFSLTIGQLLAASIALVALSSGGAWMALRSVSGAAPRAVISPTPLPDDFSPRPAGGWRVRSDAAIAELQDALQLNEGKLDTGTVRIVRQNLAVIDRAIGQAQRALRRDPGNTYLNLHLANTMRQKIELLRRANALAGQS
jgi:hypothetical protein